MQPQHGVVRDITVDANDAQPHYWMNYEYQIELERSGKCCQASVQYFTSCQNLDAQKSASIQAIPGAECKRCLAEVTTSIEQAEATCAVWRDQPSIKEWIYDQQFVAI